VGARLFVPVIAAGVGLLLGGTAGAGTRASASRSHPLVHVTISLPGPARSKVELLTLTATAKAGHVVAAPSVKSPDGGELPPGIRSVAAIMPPRSSKHEATFKIYVLINNLAGRSTAGTAGTSVEVVTATSPNWVQTDFTSLLLTGNCAVLKKISDAADTEAPHRPVDEVALEPEAVQPSDPEAVLDNVIYSECPHAEVPEPGPR
jgi:hypothetical protein